MSIKQLLLTFSPCFYLTDHRSRKRRQKNREEKTTSENQNHQKFEKETQDNKNEYFTPNIFILK